MKINKIVCLTDNYSGQLTKDKQYKVVQDIGDSAEVNDAYYKVYLIYVNNDRDQLQGVMLNLIQEVPDFKVTEYA